MKVGQAVVNAGRCLNGVASHEGSAVRRSIAQIGRCHGYCQAAGKPATWTIMNKPTSALTEEVSQYNDQKQPKAKEIFLGIDAHLARNQVARKKDNGGIQGVQSFSRRIRGEPTLVIEPKRWLGPVECSRGTKPPKQPTLRRLVKRW
jgi:hypothetical protein